MALVHMRDMLNPAYQNGYAVGAFDLVSLDFLQAIIDAAERCQAPVILSLAESHFDYFDFELIMTAGYPARLQRHHGGQLPVAAGAEHRNHPRDRRNGAWLRHPGRRRTRLRRGCRGRRC